MLGYYLIWHSHRHQKKNPKNCEFDVANICALFYKCNSEMFGDFLKVAQVVADKAGSGTRVSSSVGGYPFQDPCVSAFLL